MQMIRNLLINWRTTSAGLAMIVSSVIHLVFEVVHGTASEATWTTGLMGVVGGVGLLVAGDSAISQQAHADSTAAINDLQKKVEVTVNAVQTGDTSVLEKIKQPPVEPPKGLT